MSEEKMGVIDVYVTESYTTWLRRDAVQLNVEDYPELEGKTFEEIQAYVESNAEEMKSTDGSFDNLSEQLWDKDIEREKINDEDSAINISLKWN